RAFSSQLARGKLNSAENQSERQRLARLLGPGPQLQPVRSKQRKPQAIDAEGDAAGVSDRAGVGAQTPFAAEMIAMIVEAHARRRLLCGAHRNQQLEFHRLLDLSSRHDLADPAEERIARGLDL